MLQRGIETLKGFRQEVGRRFASIGRAEANTVVDTALLHQKAVNFYNNTFQLLESAGAFIGNHFTSREEQAFFTERVAAHFLEGIFPQGNNRPMNGRRNKIDGKLLTYTRQHLPTTLVFSPEDSFEQIASERLLDRTARDAYLAFYVDSLRKGNADQLARDFIEALSIDKPVLSYVASHHVRSEIQLALGSFAEEYSLIGNEVNETTNQ